MTDRVVGRNFDNPSHAPFVHVSTTTAPRCPHGPHENQQQSKPAAAAFPFRSSNKINKHAKYSIVDISNIFVYNDKHNPPQHVVFQLLDNILLFRTTKRHN